MFKMDYHTHSNLSDGTADISAMAAAAHTRGLNEIAITDHIDFTFPERNIISTFGAPANAAANVEAIKTAQSAFDGRIKILVGMEMSIRDDCAVQCNAVADAHDFDIIIGSAHDMDGLDFSSPEMFCGRTKDMVHKMYLENMLSAVLACDCFDVLGHFDYVERYGPYRGRPIEYAGCRDIIDEILLALIRSGRGIEINTGGIAYMGRAHPRLPVLKRYFELGGQIVTTGSDAHSPDEVGRGLDAAHELLRAAGAKYITRFSARQPEFLPIAK